MNICIPFKGQTTAQQVAFNYDNVLARIADPGGSSNWQGLLNNKTQTWSQVTTSMTVSTEYNTNWGTTKVPGNGRPMTCPCYGKIDFMQDI